MTRSSAGSCREDRLLELAQLAAGLDPELLDERPPRLLVGLERLGLAARAVEREHQLAAQALAQRVLVDQRLELADERRRGAPSARSRVDPLLERSEAQLLEPGDLAPGRRARRRSRRAAARATARARRPGGPLSRRRSKRARSSSSCATCSRYPGAFVCRRSLPEQLSELRDIQLYRLLGRRGRLLAPDRVDQPAAGDDPICLQQKQRQEGALLLPAEIECPSVRKHLERAQDPKLHADPATLTARAPLLKTPGWRSGMALKAISTFGSLVSDRQRGPWERMASHEFRLQYSQPRVYKCAYRRPTQYREVEDTDPDLVAAWLHQLDTTTGVRLPAAWFLAAIRTGHMPGETTTDDKAKATRLASTWIRNAGQYEPTQQSLLAALFDQSGRLHPWANDTTLRTQMVELWNNEHPRGQRADQEQLERAAKHRNLKNKLPRTRHRGARGPVNDGT